MNLPPIASSVTAIDLYEPNPGMTYSIEAAAQMARVSRRLIAIYYQYGLVSPVTDPDAGGWQFNDEAIRMIRRIEQLRTTCGMNIAALKLLVELMREVERLREEVRFLRGL